MPPPTPSPETDALRAQPAGRTGRPELRAALAVLLGLVLAVVVGLILGEYPFRGTTPYLAALAVPAIIGFAMSGVDRLHPASMWATCGVLSAASIGWALWISTGRGVDPVPPGGWAAIALGLAWPVAVAVVLRSRSRAHHRRPGPSDRTTDQ